ncbi:MAG: penicillin acylase family protein, partial [Candidatus Hydrogenedentales bacterium]
VRKVNNYLAPWGAPENPDPITEAENAAMVAALDQGAAAMTSAHGSLDGVFGDLFRVGRLDYEGDNVSWPVGGGSLRDEGMATLRAIGFTQPREDGTRWGQSGQTSTQVVLLTNPIQSWTQPPIGQSDIVDSPHFRDQAQQLLSEARLKPSWYDKETLLDGHVRQTLTLDVKL